MDVCTRVELVLKPGVVTDPTRMEIPCAVIGQQGFHVPFTSYVASLVSGIDVNISIETDGMPTQMHKRFPPKPEDRAEWLRDLSYVSAGVNHRAAVLVELRHPDCARFVTQQDVTAWRR